MSQSFRTDAGGRIDRTKPISFTFDGEQLSGLEGDTLASALLANGRHLVGRSFKYHRPRGILTAGSEEPNALVGIYRKGDQTPNLRATQVDLYQGLEAVSQNRFPSLDFDVGAVNDLLSPLFPAGFYYKTFMWPKAFWDRVYEPIIRAAAGLGNPPKNPDHDSYGNLYAHCDVLVIGSGPAGLAAALAASESGARVILCDEQSELGGSLLSESSATIDGQSATDWAVEAVKSLTAKDNVTLLPRTTAFGYFAQNFVSLAERVTEHMSDPDPALPRERLWQVRAKEVVIAAGAIERPMVFPENDVPGVMLAEAGRTYLNRYGVKVGDKVLITTACDTAWQAAFDLADQGAEVVAIADMRDTPPEALQSVAKARGIRVETGCVVTGVRGRKRVSGALLGRLTSQGVTSAGETGCDAILMSGGWTPTVSLYSQSRGKVVWDEALGAFVPGINVQNERSAGACAGVFGLSATLEHGYKAGEEAAKAATGNVGDYSRATANGAEAGTGGTLGAIPHDRNASKVKAFVDYQNDVTAKDVKLAVREGMHSIEHIKRYTTTGMATDQGRLSNLNALQIASTSLDKPLTDVGLTTFRQPYTPTTFGVFAGVSRGDFFDPVRKTPSHDWVVQNQGVFEDVGQWKRTWFFPEAAGEDMHDAVARECEIVRKSVGLFDASTLGKIEVVGPDAAEFLERMYTNPWKKLGIGRCRYGLMLNDAGFIIDDGVIGRIAEDRFHVTTTTGGAAHVFATMEDYLQTEWPELDVWITSTTEQYAVCAVQGPKAREVIAPFVEGIDLSADVFPHMSIATGTFCGVPCRLMRISFTGELGFEVNIPRRHGKMVWETLAREIEKHDGTVYGTETMHVLRAEKGYIIVGQETDGTVTPDDVGMSWAIGKKKLDFVGKRGLARPDLVAEGRKQLIGLLTTNPKVVLEEGAQVTKLANPPAGTPAEGHVTSSYYSPAMGRSIALAMVKDGRNLIGTKLHVPMPDGAIEVEVVETVFVDKEGRRVNG